MDQGRFGSAWGRYPDGAPGAVLVRDKVFDAFVQGPEDMIELFHGYTYSAHPLAIAAAVATLDAFEQDGILEHVNRIIPIWRKHAVALKGAKNIVDVRTAGILGAVEFAPRAGAAGERGQACSRICLENGLLVRTSGDMIVLSPPLTIGELFETICKPTG